MQLKARTVVGGGREVPAMCPYGGSELRKGGSWSRRAKTIDGMEKEKKYKKKKAQGAQLRTPNGTQVYC